MDIFAKHIETLRGSIEKDRQERAQIKKDYYEAKFIDYIDDILNKHFTKPENIKASLDYINIIEYFINKRARILKRGVEIKIEDNNEILANWIKEKNIISNLKNIERYTELLGMVAVRFFKDNGDVNFEVITPNRFYVATNLENSLSPEIFIWQRQNYTEIIPQAIRYYAYDKANFYVLDVDGNILKQEEHGYNEIPVAFIFSRPRIDEFYIESDEDLRFLMENVMIWLTSINYLVKYQGFSQPIAKGLPNNAKIYTDPSTIIRIPYIPEVNGFGDFSFVSPETKIKELWETLVNKIKTMGGKYEVNVNELVGDIKQKSGIAYEWENIQVIESREDRAEIWRSNIREFIKKYLLIKKSLNPAINKEQSIYIDFPDDKLIEDSDKEISRWLILINNNIRNKLDWIKSDNPDIKTDEDALRLLEENKKINLGIGIENGNDNNS